MKVVMDALVKAERGPGDCVITPIFATDINAGVVKFDVSDEESKCVLQYLLDTDGVLDPGARPVIMAMLEAIRIRGKTCDYMHMWHDSHAMQAVFTIVYKHDVVCTADAYQLHYVFAAVAGASALQMPMHSPRSAKRQPEPSGCFNLPCCNCKTTVNVVVHAIK